MHFNLNKSLTQFDADEENCMVVENLSLVSLELNYDRNIQHSINENEMNIQYLKSVIMNCCIPVCKTQKQS